MRTSGAARAAAVVVALMAAAGAAGCSPPPPDDAGTDGASGCSGVPAVADQACTAPAGLRCAGTFAPDCAGGEVRVYCVCTAGRWACDAPRCDAGTTD